MFHVHHVGYLVKSLPEAREHFLMLGYAVEGEAVFDQTRGVEIQFLEKDGYRVELVSPAVSDSVVSGLMKRFKNAPYHICYTVTALSGAIEALRESRFVMIDEPAPAPAIEGRRVCFLFSDRIGIIELLED